MAEMRKKVKELENQGILRGTCIELSEYGVTYMDAYGQCTVYTKDELFEQMSAA